MMLMTKWLLLPWVGPYTTYLLSYLDYHLDAEEANMRLYRAYAVTIFIELLDLKQNRLLLEADIWDLLLDLWELDGYDLKLFLGLDEGLNIADTNLYCKYHFRYEADIAVMKCWIIDSNTLVINWHWYQFWYLKP